MDELKYSGGCGDVNNGMWLMAQEGYNRGEKAHVRNRYKEDWLKNMSGGVKSENELKLEKNAEDNKRNC